MKRLHILLILLAVVIVGGGVTLYTLSVSNTADIQDMTESVSDLVKGTDVEAQKIIPFPNVVAREPSFAVEQDIWNKPTPVISDFPYIHPLCFDSILSSTKSLSSENIEIASCNEKFNSIPVEHEDEGLSIRATESYNDLTDNDSAPPNLVYKVIGKKDNVYYLLVNWNFSSPHYFSGVFAVVLSSDRKSFTLGDQYPFGGDGCLGGIENATVHGELVYIKSYLSPTSAVTEGLLRKEEDELYKTLGIQYFDFGPEYRSCLGSITTATNILSKDSTKIVSVEFSEKISSSDFYGSEAVHQKCFIQTFNTYAKDTPTLVTPNQFQEFREKFYSCVQKPQ